MKKFNIKKIMYSIVILLIIIFLFKGFRDKKSEIQENVQNSTAEIISETAPDDVTPDEIVYMKLSNEDKVKCSSVIGTFDNGKNLTTQQYLNVALYAINSGIISNNKISYSESEIRDIIYSIFDVELSENSSISGMTYDNGVYKIEKKKVEKANLENIETDVAAGSLYIMYELDGNSYIAKLTTNGVTGENYVSSIISNN